MATRPSNPHRMTKYEIPGRLRRASMRIALIVASTILAFSTTAFGQSLSGKQIRETLIGNTFSGVDEDGESFSERLNPDGLISGRSPSGSYSGRWRISGKQICFLYPQGD